MNLERLGVRSITCLGSGLDSGQKGLLNATETAPTQNGDHDGASGTSIAEAHIAAASVPVYCHLRNERDPNASGNHPENTTELVTLEGNVRRDARMGARSYAEVAETVAIAQHDKGLSAKALERK